MTVTIVARYRVQPGKADEVAAILSRHVAATRAEPGCLQFDACRSADDPDEIVLFERYVDEEAFTEHRTSRHFNEYVEGGVVPLLREREWHRYADIGPHR